MTNKKTQQRRARTLRRDMTAAEVALWTQLRGRRIGVRFRRQMPLGPFIVDFVCVEARLVVELDGAGHYAGWGDYDSERDRYLESRGFRVLRFENVELMDGLDAVLARIREALAR